MDSLSLIRVFAAVVVAGRCLLAAPCPPEGDNPNPKLQALDRLKNRTTAATNISPAITLEKILAPGNDSTRWNETDSATITGYVVEVKLGGLESCNCHSKINRDWHIVIGATAKGLPNNCMIVEITPNFPLPGLNPKSLLGKKIQVTGHLLYDTEHWAQSDNTAKKGEKLIWRKTAWELHPVTKIVVL